VHENGTVPGLDPPVGDERGQAGPRIGWHGWETTPSARPASDRLAGCRLWP
jgi:hypothetical protein